MFDKLIDLIILIWNDITIFKEVSEFEEGVRLRFGKFNKILKPGWAFKIPFIDSIICKFVKDDTILLPSQKLTTKDNKTITLTGMVLYNVDDIKPYIINVNLPSQTISDVAMGVISDIIVERTYNEVVESIEKLSNEVSKIVRRECRQWGIKIEYVKITDICLSRTFNIFKNSESHL